MGRVHLRAVLSAAQRAIDRAHHARNPHGAWRYPRPSLGDNDTSLTGWMVAALLAGEYAGFWATWVAACTPPRS